MNSKAPMALRRIRVIGNAKYDGGRMHRAQVIAETREDRAAAIGSAVAAGILIGLMLAAMFGGK